MNEMRAQGRPPRGDGEVGRTRLLERTRDALKCRPRIDIQRREIAIVAGVTPALISYYYPDKWDLFAAAAKPVIESYIAEIQSILRSDATPRARISSLANFFVHFNSHHGHLFDFYIENNERMAEKEDAAKLQVAYEELSMFFDDLLRSGLIRGGSSTFMRLSLWGLCKCLAHQSHLLTLAAPSEEERVLREVAENVCNLFLNGVATPQFPFQDDGAPFPQEILDRSISGSIFTPLRSTEDSALAPVGHFSGSDRLIRDDLVSA